jgi:outer membrane protein
MKKSLYTLLLVGMSLSLATAQTEKGRWTVGTEAGNLIYRNQNFNKTFSADLTPSAGYFLANGLLVGTGLPISFTHQTASSFISKYTGTGIGLSPFIRYYFGPSRLKPYAGLSYSYIRVSRQYVTPGGDASGKGYSTVFAPTVGLAYFINRTVALNAGLNYTSATSDTPGLRFSGQPNPTPSVIMLKSNDKSLSLAVGFQLFFGK